jgi:hypothetical protein
VKISQSGQVVYKAEKQACRAFPDLNGDGMQSGPKRNYQILSPLDFLAEFTQHIPPKGSHLIRYYDWYSNKARGMRNKAAAEPSAEPSSRPPLRGGARDTPVPPARGCSQTWAMLIKRVYEIDPLACPRCGGQMKVVAFIEPPQREVIEKILRGHQSAAMVGGLWHASTPRAPPAGDGSVHDPDGASDRQTGSSDEPQELTYVDIDTFLATF